MLRELHTFEITCDGLKPNGEPCPCDIKIRDIESSGAAIRYAEHFGWTHDATGRWLCNAGGGHLS